MVTSRERARELAQALLNGSGRSRDTLELCYLILADPEEPGPQEHKAIKAAAQRLYDAIVRHTGAELSSDICEQIMRESAEQPGPRPLTDAELQALANLAGIERDGARCANGIRLAAGHAPAYGEDWESEATKRLRAELERRGVLR